MMDFVDLSGMTINTKKSLRFHIMLLSVSVLSLLASAKVDVNSIGNDKNVSLISVNA